ncbi:MAG: MFS transporter, partial [Bryobacteraceae bacterium]
MNPFHPASAGADTTKLVLLSMVATSCMLAHQVAGKAARDGFFLLQFPATDLPKMVVTAALLSFGLAALFGRLLERIGPRQLVPVAFTLSAVLHLAEWMAVSQQPRATAILIYLHIVGLGAILLSGFWSLLSELFDPREAKRRFGRIAAAGTGGGILGGIAAERLGAWTYTNHLLLLLAFLHLACAALAYSLHTPGSYSPKHYETVTAREAFHRTPLIWRLAALVFISTCSASLLDYLFKQGASAALGKG